MGTPQPQKAIAERALTLQRELAALANKVVVADQRLPEERIGLRQAVDKVAAMVSLGLDLHADGNEDLAVTALQEVFLEHLFRLGFSQIARAPTTPLQDRLVGKVARRHRLPGWFFCVLFAGRVLLPIGASR